MKFAGYVITLVVLAVEVISRKSTQFIHSYTETNSRQVTDYIRVQLRLHVTNIFLFKLRTEEVRRVGNPILTPSAGQNIDFSDRVILMTTAALQPGNLFGFSAYFTSLDPVYFQVRTRD